MSSFPNDLQSRRLTVSSDWPTRITTLLCASLAGASVPLASFGADSSAEGSNALDEVVVTAQRRSERLVDVPISVNSFSQEELEAKRIDSIDDLTKVVTSLRFEGTTPYYEPTLRGIGTLVQGGAVSTSVPIYLDGVYLPNTSGMTFDLANVNNVQVLKGPQGTLFGRNTTGGAILITTSTPSSTPTGHVQVTYGSFEDVRVQGYLSGALAEYVTAGISAYYRHSNGAVDNISTGSNNDERVNEVDVRPEIRFSNNDNFSLRLIYEHLYDFDATSTAATNPDGYALARNIPGAVLATGAGSTAIDQKPTNLNKADAGTAIADWKVSDALALKSVTSYRHDSADFVADGDASSLPLFAVQTISDYKTFSEEFTLSGKSGSWDWVAGAFYWNQKEAEPNTQVIYGPPFFPTITPVVVASATVKTDSIAGFADATYEATHGLFLTVGGRYTSEHEDLDYLPGGVGPALTDSHRWNAFTPRAVVRYQFDIDNNVYGSYSKGFKSGAFAGYPPNRVDPEHNDAYEVGFKHASKTFDLNTSIFYYDFKDPQVTTFDFQTGLSQTINAEGQTNYGAELEMVFRPVHAWQIRLAGAYLSATYKNFPEATIFVPVGAGVWSQAPQNADGTTVPRSPKWSGNAATSYDIDTKAGTLQLAANVAWSSYFFHYENEQAREPGYAEVGLNASLTSRDSHWRGALFVTNLNDHHRATQLALGPAGTVGLWAPPRTIGGSLSYKF